MALENGEVIDSSVMSVKELREFFRREIKECEETGQLMSLHMKATMMKVSDPIIFGHCVREFYSPVFEKYSEEFSALVVNPNNGV